MTGSVRRHHCYIRTWRKTARQQTLLAGPVDVVTPVTEFVMGALQPAAIEVGVSLAPGGFAPGVLALGLGLTWRHVVRAPTLPPRGHVPSLGLRSLALNLRLPRGRHDRFGGVPRPGCDATWTRATLVDGFASRLALVDVLRTRR